MAVTQTRHKQSEAELLAVEDDVNVLEPLSANLRFAGDSYIVESSTLYLRRKVAIVPPRLINTLHGLGYVLRKPAP